MDRYLEFVTIENTHNILIDPSSVIYIEEKSVYPECASALLGLSNGKEVWVTASARAIRDKIESHLNLLESQRNLQIRLKRGEEPNGKF